MASTRLPGALRQILETPLGDDVVVPELPPIEVKTRDEVREVVQVLNDVQDRTLALAADQAVLRRNIADSFVNLGRRNQNLLDRQLAFITELEQSETEPEELESLFRLDHLATRMRRNAESLLVLAGVESPRQWADPVACDDVIRASLGEVEDYQRVTVRHLDDVRFAGEAASGLSHVLAELIENALNFSPPTEQVELKGRRTDDGYLLAIDDDGIGMSPEEIEQANRRLSGEESYTVAPSRYLGHYVAGNLAQRFGIGLRLQDRPAGGVTATVSIPSALLVDVAPELPDELTLDPIETSVNDASAPVPVARAAEGPSSLAEALGRPQMDSIESSADLTAAIDGRTAGITLPPAAADGALPKRVPGAQRPDLEPTIARRPSAPDPEPASAPSTDAFGFLAGFAAVDDDAADGPVADGTETDAPATFPTEEDR
ncbi:ATP-binding protein [Actinospongicola halichondriae]|uniref:sensor histidine kinase n=1 Tax=Actinospongicola halichondriae TaxID=3236844 RepID=UPI003D43AA53